MKTDKLSKMQGTLAERKTVPELGCRSPAISLSMVDLPMPFGPTTAYYDIQISDEYKESPPQKQKRKDK